MAKTKTKTKTSPEAAAKAAPAAAPRSHAFSVRGNQAAEGPASQAAPGEMPKPVLAAPITPPMANPTPSWKTEAKPEGIVPVAEPEAKAPEADDPEGSKS